MKIKKLKSVSIFILSFFALFAPASVFALDINYEYPSIFWGTTSVTDTSNGNSFYSQTWGNVAVRNIAANTWDEFLYNPFCVITGIQKPCFTYLNDRNLKVLNAHTYVNGFLKNTLAVLGPVGINVFGDSFNASGNFNYWGRHLRQGSDASSSNAFWQMKNYSFNPLAQAYWNSGNNQTMNDTIARLTKNTKNLPALSSGNFNGVCGFGFGADCPSASQYPEGRVWIYGGLPDSATEVAITLNNDLNYYGNGTVIIPNGDLVIDGNVGHPLSASNSSLGFIIRHGNLIIRNTSGAKKKIKAFFFVPNGNISVSGSNIDLTGSFVTGDFIVSSLSSNINFIYDSRGESVYPPGFRELQIPSMLAK